MNKLHYLVTPMDVYQYAKKKQLNNSNFSRILESDWLRSKLGMFDQIKAERLNQLVGSNNVFSHEKNQLHGLIIS